MTNHPNRTIAAARKRILAEHEQYKRVDTEGRENIRRNITKRLQEMYAGGSAEQLYSDYKSAHSF